MWQNMVAYKITKWIHKKFTDGADSNRKDTSLQRRNSQDVNNDYKQIRYMSLWFTKNDQIIRFEFGEDITDAKSWSRRQKVKSAKVE